ncbi:glycoside hydrolase family 43 protein [Paenibacillus arenilitoris]|uniref:Glycoside hydrolase family 43 protein n=1 Tax=Paenibacillus arenilitoris TaxID=2772299 RepID=A0A927H838_9BACL|nr:glycoside hydrolase family 43 protein [Paenibacillus arenilitoris]MBD2872311.1 glycoside hydrolase family 43 protein [Paenibacillus arenilitoris]
MINNPILPGFNPDASILRVGDDYYIATSTFEWFPGVQLYHSKDLAHWELLPHALQRTSQLDLRGNPSSGGVWAPALSYHDGTYYLLFTDVKGRKGVYKDLHNYVVTADSMLGPWSEPVYLNGSGFDPYLFHDDDGTKWLLNMQWDFRDGRSRFGGIVMQQYDPIEKRLIGPVKTIYEGTELGVTEGPQLLRRGGYYYLLVAEGGTGINHAATLARSRSIGGPYETDPAYPVMTTRGAPGHPLQNAGHGMLVETQKGEWYMCHICSRPFPGTKLNPLGRETSLQRCVWTEDGWLRLAHEGRLPALTVPAPDLEQHPFPAKQAKDDFNAPALGREYQTLRVPAEDAWLSLTERPGFLRLRGRESLHSWHRQSMVARRLQHFRCTAETRMEYEPEHFMQMAGLAFYYDESDYYYLRVTQDGERGRKLGVLSSASGKYGEHREQELSVDGWPAYYLRAVVRERSLRFYASPDGGRWQAVGGEFDLGVLSDEHGGKLGFTGTMIGLCAQDLNGTGKHADFDYFAYSAD